MRPIIAVVISSALWAAIVFGQMGTTAPVPAKHIVFGHEIEENTLYYIMSTGTPRDSLIKLEACPTNQGSSTSWSSFARLDIPGRAEPYADQGVYSNVVAAKAATVKRTALDASATANVVPRVTRP